MPVEDLEGKPFTCHICSKECTYAPLYTNVYVTGILWFVDCKQCSYSVSEAGTLRSWLTLLLLLLTKTVHKHIHQLNFTSKLQLIISVS